MLAWGLGTRVGSRRRGRLSLFPARAWKGVGSGTAAWASGLQSGEAMATLWSWGLQAPPPMAVGSWGLGGLGEPSIVGIRARLCGLWPWLRGLLACRALVAGGSGLDLLFFILRKFILLKKTLDLSLSNRSWTFDQTC
jgi:hypothetical protein